MKLKGGSHFRTQIELGEKYIDKATGFKGTATAVHFYEHACERVTLKGINSNGEIVEYVFDAPELKDDSDQPVLTRKAGGPHDRTPVARR